jgi:hypothetical protein
MTLFYYALSAYVYFGTIKKVDPRDKPLHIARNNLKQHLACLLIVLHIILSYIGVIPYMVSTEPIWWYAYKAYNETREHGDINGVTPSEMFLQRSNDIHSTDNNKQQSVTMFVIEDLTCLCKYDN